MKKYIIGIDEVGTGSAISHFTVCAVKAEANWKIPGLKDSKKLTATKRESMLVNLINCASLGDITYAIVERSCAEIDAEGLAKALRSAYIEIVKKMYCEDSHIIIDGNMNFSKTEIKDFDYECLIKADDSIPTVQAASIIGKVARDSQIIEISKLYPEYNFASNKGYLTKDHLAAIQKFGKTPIHRKSYNIKY